MSLSAGEVLKRLFSSDSIISSSLSSIPLLFFYMTSIALACFLWFLVGVLGCSNSATSSSSSSSHNNKNDDKSFSTVEAFRNIFQQRIVQPADKHIRTPLQTLLDSSSRSNSHSKESSSSKAAATTATLSTSTSLFLSSQAFSTAYRDLAPPFNISIMNNNNNNNNNINNNNNNNMDDSENNPDVANNASTSTASAGVGATTTASMVSLEDLIVPDANVTHFCFLVHGHRGLSRDLAYFQAVMERWVVEELQQQQQQHNNNNNNKGVAAEPSTAKEEKQTSSSSLPFISTKQQQQPKQHTHDMVVHNAVCNEGKTQDGVENGGERLVEEMRQVIDTEMKKRHEALNVTTDNKDHNDADDPAKEAFSTEIYDITISILGNSLGGLFARYAIAKLVERHCVKEEESTKPNSGKDKPAPTWILDGKYRLHLNIFCTTATPHLGVSGHTWVRIPRTAEIGVAHALGQSGKDLFRLNDLLHTMATSSNFLGALGSFRKRIAYANCYGTDFAVPVGTAAFLSENSTYPHHFLDDDYIVDENGMVIAALHTPAKEDNGDEVLEEHSDELHQMSSSLDKLGWKKVFVDVRKEMPSVELPKSLGERLLRQKKQNSDADMVNSSGSNHSRDSVNSTASDENSENSQSLQALKKQKIVGSRDIANAVSTPEDNRVALPLGHNMIVAFSRSRFTTFMNKGGRPVVDALAKELVDDIFSWDGSSDPPPVTKLASLTTVCSSSTVASRLVQSTPASLATND